MNCVSVPSCCIGTRVVRLYFKGKSLERKDGGSLVEGMCRFVNYIKRLIVLKLSGTREGGKNLQA